MSLYYDTTREEYVAVLKNEVEILKTYYKPETEGTGHFNTAITVLENRIKEIEETENV